MTGSLVSVSRIVCEYIARLNSKTAIKQREIESMSHRQGRSFTRVLNLHETPMYIYI